MIEINLHYVNYIPKELEAGILYVSEEFEVAIHLCPCGCGNKIVTPLGPAEWSLTVKNSRPTLYPSIGNWQLPCRTHYWIEDGFIDWSYSWTDKQVQAGRHAENRRREKFYGRHGKKNKQSVTSHIINFIKRIIQ